ncbi:DUF357 domain-containing protein [Candidatus Woesearchaeota archaeon]|nr:DUF357 domain-containing protein [Candidatus Woesearchaeota archaeon]
MQNITKEKLDKYFSIAEKALEKAKASKEKINIKNGRKEFIDMIENYLSDARHFERKKDFVNAFAALNYAHGWLDAGARLGIFDVHDPGLFAQD